MTTWHPLKAYGDDIAVSMLTGEGEQRRMILLPFEGNKLSPQVIESALTMAETTCSELVLLCIRPPADVMRYAEEGEQLFSDLRGLQARMQSLAIPVRIRTVAGSVAQFLLDYARRHDTQFIMIPGYPADTHTMLMA